MKLIISAMLAVLLTSCNADDDNLLNIDKGNHLVTINGSKVGEGYIDLLSRVNPRIEAQLQNPFAKKQLVNNLVDQELLYQESIKRGLQKTKDVQEKVALYKRVIISQALLEDEVSKRSKKYYEENKDADFKKVQISHIEISFPKKKPNEITDEDKAKTLAKAVEIKEKLNAGGDFASLAKEFSDDRVSNQKGGDLGKVSMKDKRLERRGIEAIGQKAFEMKKGDISDPIETKQGYHIVKVGSDIEVTPLIEAEQIIQFQLQKEVKDELLAVLKTNAKIEYPEEDKTPTQTAPSEPAETATPEADVKPEAVVKP